MKNCMRADDPANALSAIPEELTPNCLVHRYDGSDLLEPAFLIRQGKVNAKIATRVKDFTKPIVLSKQKIFAFDPEILCAVQTLRNERTAAMRRYDRLIQSHWQKLIPFTET